MKKVLLITVLILLFITACNKEKPMILSEQIIDGSENCKKITYLSDNLEVVGYIVTPINIDDDLPVIIYNRGGNREFGKITDRMTTKFFTYLASKGYVVLASQYRGNDGGEGTEQFGGTDLNDVLNLIELAKTLPYVNEEQIFMLGFSRGGMMTYMACKESDDIKAAVVIGGVSDLIQSYNKREAVMKNVLKDLIGGSPEELEDEYKKRSAYYWADQIHTPLLIIHGELDWRVDKSQAEKMAEKLEQFEADYKLIIYPDEDHGLRNNNKFEEAIEETLQWFEAHK